jgi:hypothetical protein
MPLIAQPSLPGVLRGTPACFVWKAHVRRPLVYVRLPRGCVNGLKRRCQRLSEPRLRKP